MAENNTFGQHPDQLKRFIANPNLIQIKTWLGCVFKGQFYKKKPYKNQKPLILENNSVDDAFCGKPAKKVKNQCSILQVKKQVPGKHYNKINSVNYGSLYKKNFKFSKPKTKRLKWPKTKRE